jgi:hypothetical protein
LRALVEKSNPSYLASFATGFTFGTIREEQMVDDQFTEVTHTSWGGRLRNSIAGVVIGVVLFIGAFPLLFWNEGRAVKRYRTLAEGEGAVVSVSPDRVDPSHEGSLVHMSGTADSGDTLADDLFDVALSALRLQRKVEMYQWKERKQTRRKKKTGGGTRKVTRYSYSKVWSTTLIRSSRFKRRSGHENPTAMPFSSETFDARVTVGAFQLSPELVQKIDNWESLEVDVAGPLPEILEGQGEIYGEGFYLGHNAGAPQIGDVRITFAAVFPGTVSLVASQEGGALATYRTRSGGTLGLLQTGEHSAEEMFKTARDHNRLLTWGLRAGGLLLMFIGLILLANPLSTLAGILPLVGGLVAAGTWLVAFILALFLGSLVIGVAWVFYRPLLGLGLMAGGVALAAGVLVTSGRRDAKKNGPLPGQRVPDGPPVRPPAPGDSPPASPPPAAPPKPPPPPRSSGGQVPPPPSRPVAAWMNAGEKAFGAGRFAEAAAAFEKAAAQDPANGTILFNLGAAQTKAGAGKEGLEALKRAARSGHPKARKLLASKKIGW